MKRILGGVGGIIAIGVIVAIKMLAPSAEVAIKNSTGTGWNDAKNDFMTEITTTLTTEYATFGFAPSIIQTISNCIADKSIAFLNTTDCSYLYNTATTTEAQHLAAQEQCMNKVQFDQKQEGFTLECTREAFPDDWKYMQNIFSGEFEKSFAAQGVPADTAKQMGLCIADKLTTLMNTRQCKLINRQAAKVEDIFYGLEDCIKDTDNDKDFQEVITSCTGQAAPEEEAAPTGKTKTKTKKKKKGKK